MKGYSVKIEYVILLLDEEEQVLCTCGPFSSKKEMKETRKLLTDTDKCRWEEIERVHYLHQD